MGATVAGSTTVRNLGVVFAPGAGVELGESHWGCKPVSNRKKAEKTPPPRRNFFPRI